MLAGHVKNNWPPPTYTLIELIENYIPTVHTSPTMTPKGGTNSSSSILILGLYAACNVLGLEKNQISLQAVVSNFSKNVHFCIINISQPPTDGLFIIKVSSTQKPPASEHNIHHLLAAQTFCSKNFIYQMTGKLIITAVQSCKKIPGESFGD